MNVNFEDVAHITSEEYFKESGDFSLHAYKNKYPLDEIEAQFPAKLFWRVAKTAAQYEKTPELQEYWAKRWFAEMWLGYWRPAGSILAGLGSSSKISISNCFSKDTTFITSTGIKSFADCYNNQSVSVLNNYGKYVDGIVKYFGQQKLWKISMSRHTVSKSIFCTSDHRWRIKNDKTESIRETTTDKLKAGDRIPYVKKNWEISKNNESRYYCPIGYIHGLVFGDGWYNKTTNTCQLDLCGDSKELKKYFNNGQWSLHESNGVINITKLPNYFKQEIPTLEKYNSEYVLGFLIGYFAADGTIDKDGRCSLSSSNKEHLSTLKDRIESLGIYSSEIRLKRDRSPFDGNMNHKLYELYLWKDCLFDSFFTKTKHYRHWSEYKQRTSNKKLNNDWVVESIEETDLIDDVWCVEVPEYENFTLSCGINTKNCTTIELKEDTLESIFETGYKVAKSAAYRQGLGVDFSRLRPRGSVIKNSARVSTGSISWMDFINKIGNHVGQAGRIPAMLFSLNISHPDVIEFITAKSNQNMIPNANISIQITDKFMEAYEKNLDWELSFYVPDNNERIVTTIKAKDLMELLAKEARDFAEPGVQFIDTCIRESMTDVVGFPIKSTNACSEKFMTPDSTCVLASFNVGMFPFTDYKELIKELTPGVVRFLDNCVQYELEENKSPFENQKYVVSQLREIGIGITNLNGWLIKENLAYDSEKGMKAMTEFIKTLSIESWIANIALGKEKGNAPAFQTMLDKNDGDNSFIYNSEFAKRLKSEGIDITHCRCMNVMSIAPTGTLSLTFPEMVESTGIEPFVGFYWWKRTRASGKYEWYFVIPKFVRDELIKRGYENVPTSVMDNDGVEGDKWISIIDKYFDPNVFKPAHYIDPMKKVDFMADVAKWIDSSISVTYNLKEDVSNKTVEDIYYYGWKKGVKSIAVYRDKSRQGIIEFESPKLVEKRFSKQEKQNRPETIEVHQAAKRPKELPCNIHRSSIKGNKYIILIGLLNSMPYEVFLADEDQLDEISTRLAEGMIVKSGSGKYSLVSKDRIIVKDISNHIKSDYEDVTRLISLSLRTGTPVDYIVEQLEKSKGTVVDASQALARTLKKYIGKLYRVGACSECGSTNIDYSTNCPICLDCGNSKCG